jgi:hypothetical protein
MRIGLGLILCLLVAGCGSNPTCDPASPPSLAQMKHDIITPSCAAFTVCHNSVGTMAMLDLSGDVYKALVNASTVCTSPCVDGATDFPKRVVPSDLDHSFLWKKLNLPAAIDPKYGNRMPQSNPPLDSGSLDTISCWIRGGAPNN